MQQPVENYHSSAMTNADKIPSAVTDPVEDAVREPQMFAVGEPSETNREQQESSPIVFFDGVCGLCNRFVNFVLPRDRHARLRFAPLQGETAHKFLSSRDAESLESIIVVDERGIHRSSTAVVQVLRQLGGWWNLVGRALWLIPRPLRNLGYKMVARQRYRLFGKKESCRLPSPEEQSRFLP